MPTTEESQQAESPVTMAEVIRQLMVDHRPADLYTAFTDIPEKKLRNALKSYGDDPKGELIPYVLALYDATVAMPKTGFCCLPAASCTGNPALSRGKFC